MIVNDCENFIKEKLEDKKDKPKTFSIIMAIEIQSDINMIDPNEKNDDAIPHYEETQTKKLSEILTSKVKDIINNENSETLIMNTITHIYCEEDDVLYKMYEGEITRVIEEPSSKHFVNIL